MSRIPISAAVFLTASDCKVDLDSPVWAETAEATAMTVVILTHLGDWRDL